MCFFSEGYVTCSLFVRKLSGSISIERNPTNKSMLKGRKVWNMFTGNKGTRTTSITTTIYHVAPNVFRKVVLIENQYTNVPNF